MDKTKLALEIFDKYAEEYQTKFMDVDLYHDSLDLFCEAILKEKARVLEIGCGPGNITKYLLKKRPDLNILGTDIAPKMLELAKINNPKAKFQLFDCRHINTLEKKYDALMCGFCLPYLSKEDAIKLLMGASQLLEQNGIIYLSTMEDDYSNSGFKVSSSGDKDMAYIYYHEEAYLTKTLIENDFTILDVRHKIHPQQIGTTARDIIILAKKKL